MFNGLKASFEILVIKEWVEGVARDSKCVDFSRNYSRVLLFSQIFVELSRGKLLVAFSMFVTSRDKFIFQVLVRFNRVCLYKIESNQSKLLEINGV